MISVDFFTDFFAKIAKGALFALIALVPISAFGQPSQDQLRVASYDCPPFVIYEGGEFSGLSIFLWEQIAQQLSIDYSIAPYNLKDMLGAVANGEVDIGVSCTSITEEREKEMDFSHSFYETHLAIAVKQQGYLSALKGILTNKKLLVAVGIVFLIAAIIGGTLFLLEHNVNPKLYSMDNLAGKLAEAFIIGLLFVTRGPIRYYEFKTFTARIISAVLAISSTFLIAGITAVLASAFTVEHFRSQVTGLHDLGKVRVAAKEASTSSEYLVQNRIGYRSYESLEDMLTALERGAVDAVVTDGAILKYMIKKGKEEGRYEMLSILPYQFEKQNYGLALKENSPYLEEINQALLSVRKSKEWKKALLDYFNE